MSHISVVRRWMVLCRIVTQVELTRSPVNTELFECFPVLQPVQVHIHRFRAFWLYLLVDDSLGRRIVSLDGRGWLFVSHFFEGESDVYAFFCDNE